MVIKSNAHMMYIIYIIGEFAFFCAGIVITKMEGKELIGCLLGYFILLYAIISTWFCNGKTIMMDAEGCYVCAWKFKRKYLWNELKTKRLEYYKIRYEEPRRGIVFCIREIGEMNWSHPGIYGPIRPYLDYFYVTFPVDEEDRTWMTEYKNVVNEYEVNEQEFMAKMHEWGVRIENGLPPEKRKKYPYDWA